MSLSLEDRRFVVTRDGNLTHVAEFMDPCPPEEEAKFVEALRAFYTFAVQWAAAGRPGLDDDTAAAA